MAVPSVYAFASMGADDLTPRPGFTAIYGLFDPQTLALRYIGKAVHPRKRLEEHLRHALLDKKRTPVRMWVRKLRRAGLAPHLRLIEWTTDQDWAAAERRHISAARTAGCHLLNLAPGGQGPAGIAFSAEHRAKLVAALQRRWEDPEQRAHLTAALRGRTFSDAALANLRASGIKRRGRTRSAEARARQSAAMTGKKHTPERVAARRERQRGRPLNLSEAQRAALSARLKGRTMSPESSAKKRAAMLGRTHSAETKAKQSASAQARWAKAKAQRLGDAH